MGSATRRTRPTLHFIRYPSFKISALFSIINFLFISHRCCSSVWHSSTILSRYNFASRLARFFFFSTGLAFLSSLLYRFVTSFVILSSAIFDLSSRSCFSIQFDVATHCSLLSTHCSSAPLSVYLTSLCLSSPSRTFSDPFTFSFS